MINYVIISALAFLLAIPSHAQLVQVLNRSTNQPIPGVYIYNSRFSTTANTNEQGEFNLTLFEDDDIISFQHPSYQPLTARVSDLVETKTLYLDELIVKMNEVVVAANKWEQSSTEIPHTILAIDRKEIEFSNPQTSADLLQNTGQVFIQKSQLGGGSPMIRGFAANSVLIIVDGVRMNNAIFRSGNLQNIINVDPLALEGSEPIFGPGSVIYGSDALGGVMDFHTKDPEFSQDKSLKGNMLLRTSSANREKTGHVTIHWTGPRFSFSNYFTYSDFGDLRSGGRLPDKYPTFGLRPEYVKRIGNTDVIVKNPTPFIQKGTAYSQWSNISRLGWKINDHSHLTYGLYHSNTSNIPRYDRLIRYRNGKPRSAEWYYGPQTWTRNHLEYNTYKSGALKDEARLIIAHQKFSESRISRDFEDDWRFNREEQVQAVNVLADLSKQWKERTRLFYGMEYQLNTVNSAASSQNIVSGQKTNASTRYPDGGSIYQSLAGYSSVKHDLSNDIILNGGLRYTQVLLEASFDDKTFYNFPFNELTLNDGLLTGNVGLVWKITPSTTLDILGSSGFRAPNVDDAGKLFDSEPGNVVVPNSNLESEKSYNIDVALRKNFSQTGRIELSIFRTWLQDVIVRRNFNFLGQDSILYDGVMSRVQSLVNVNAGMIYGGSISLQWQWGKRWALRSFLTLTEGEDNEGLSLRHAPPLFGKTSLTYQYGSFQLEFYSHYNASIPFEELNPSEQNKTHLYTPEGALGWYTFNIRGRYNFKNGWRINAAIENITDQHYRTYSSGLSAPGINAILSVQYQIP